VPLSLPSGTLPEALTYVDTIDEVWLACTGSADVQRVNRSTFALVGLPIATTSALPKSIIHASSGEVWVGSVADIDVIDTSTLAIVHTINNPGQQGNGMIENGGIVYSTDTVSDLIRTYDTTTYTPLTTYATGLQPKRILFAPTVLLVGNGGDDDVTPYLLDCSEQLPNSSMANRNILFNWTLQFDFFDNTEYYTYQQKLVRPSPARIGDFVNDFVDIIIEEYQDDGSTLVINTLCPTTNTVHIKANLQSPKLPFSVGIELQPVRGGVFSSEAPQSVIVVPNNSPFITNLIPSTLTSVSAVEFDLDVPKLPIQGDYTLNLHFILK
jgi:hypothetical protein